MECPVRGTPNRPRARGFANTFIVGYMLILCRINEIQYDSDELKYCETNSYGFLRVNAAPVCDCASCTTSKETNGDNQRRSRKLHILKLGSDCKVLGEINRRQRENKYIVFNN